MSGASFAPELVPNPHVGSISARQGAAEALRALLLGMVANADGGTDVDRAFQLKSVFARFPMQEAKLDMPCASVTDASVADADDDDDDVMLDRTYIPELKAALMFTEVSGVFSVDFWANDDVERQAIEIAFSSLFRSQGFAQHVVVAAPDTTLPRAWRGRWAMKVRLSVQRHPVPMDDGASGQRDEYRAHAEVEWDAEVVTAAEVEVFKVVSPTGRVVLFEDGALTAEQEN